MNNAKIGTALIGGYVLGRRKKARAALGVGMMLAGSRLRSGQLGKALSQSPILSGLNEQVRGELTNAGKAAASSVLTAKAGSMADALHQRTEEMRTKSGRADDAGPAEESPEERDEPDERDEHETGGTGAGEPAQRSAESTRRRAGSSSRRGSSSGSGGSAAGRARKEPAAERPGRSAGRAAKPRRSDDG